MSMIQADDGAALYAESTGTGTPLLFIHEFAGDHRSWEPQVRHFGGGYRCITYANTGHTVNLEEPGAFNTLVSQFLAAAERSSWPRRDPRSLSPSITGMSP
ncbi:MAG TPA: alpha/beta hydrolase [Streptosporangiaceae bacterium]|jgi:pimeloyl-ACP methyl ester carboxylesterase